MLSYILILSNIDIKQEIINQLRSLGIKNIMPMSTSKYLRFDALPEQYKLIVQQFSDSIYAHSEIHNLEIQSDKFSGDINCFKTISAYIPDLPRGNNVDIIICDTDNVRSNYNLFGSRLKNIDWYSYTTPGLFTGIYNSTPSTTAMSHADDVAISAASSPYGWASEANVFSININRTISNGVQLFPEMIINWHNSKTNNNPTIVIMSFSYASLRTLFKEMNSININYRGNNYLYDKSMNIIDFCQSKGIIIQPIHSENALEEVNFQYKSYDSLDDIDVATSQNYIDLIEHPNIISFCSAANDSRKIVYSGVDFDNYISYRETIKIGNTTIIQNRTDYYNRPGYPLAFGAIGVGAISYADNSKAPFSNCGNAVDIYAPGQNVIPTGSIVSGTSFANPIVAGMVACYLSDNPSIDISTTGVREWLINNSVPLLIDRYSEDDPQDLKSIQSPSTFNRVAHYPDKNIIISAETPPLSNRYSNIENIVLNTVDRHYIKSDSNSYISLIYNNNFEFFSGLWFSDYYGISYFHDPNLSTGEKFAIFNTGTSLANNPSISISSVIRFSNLNRDNFGFLFKFEDILNMRLLKFTPQGENMLVEYIRRINGNDTILASNNFRLSNQIYNTLDNKNYSRLGNISINFSVNVDQTKILLYEYIESERSWSTQFNFSYSEENSANGKMGLYVQDNLASTEQDILSLRFESLSLRENT